MIIACIFSNQIECYSISRCVRPQIASVLHVFSSVEEPNLLAHPGRRYKSIKYLPINLATLLPSIYQYIFKKSAKKTTNISTNISTSPHLLLRRLLLRSQPIDQVGTSWKGQNHSKAKPWTYLHLWDTRYDIPI